MSRLSDEFQDLEVELAVEWGATATLQMPTTTTAADGEVTETAVAEHAVVVAGPVDEAKRYASSGTDSRVTATFYLPAKDLAAVPTMGCRLVIGSVTWQIVAVSPDTINGVVTSYRLDCGRVVVDG
jgi:hypothetical protein